MPYDLVLTGDTRIYRVSLQPGEAISISLTTYSGDSDLYLWRPDGSQAGFSNLDGTILDQVSFTADQAGDYQVEVYGHLDSDYRLVYEIGSPTMLIKPMSLSGDKPIHLAPVVSPQQNPSVAVWLPSAPVFIHGLYLPLLSWQR